MIFSPLFCPAFNFSVDKQAKYFLQQALIFRRGKKIFAMRESAFRVKGKYLGQKLSLFGHKSKTPILKIFLKGELKIREIATKHQGALKSLLSSPERFFVRIFNFTSTLLCGLIAIFFSKQTKQSTVFLWGRDWISSKTNPCNISRKRYHVQDIFVHFYQLTSYTNPSCQNHSQIIS